MSVETLEMPVEYDKLSPITKVQAEISRMKNEYTGLIIKDVDDKEGFIKVKTARIAVKNTRVGIEKERKILVEDSVKWQRQVNDAANTIKDQLIEIESSLQKTEDDHLAEKEQIKAEVERLRKEKIQSRAQVITAFTGVSFNGVCYMLGSASIEQSEVENLSDDVFQSKVEILEAEYQNILKERLEAERIAKEEAERIEAQRIEQEAAEEEIKRQKDELAAERKRIEDEKAAHQAELKRIQIEKDAEIKRQQDAIEAEKKEVARQAELEKARKEAAEKAVKDEQIKADRLAAEKAKAEKLAKEKAARALEKRPDIEKLKDMQLQITNLIDSFKFKTQEGIEAQQGIKAGLESLFNANSIKPE
jgi:hypothetical protein